MRIIYGRTLTEHASGMPLLPQIFLCLSMLPISIRFQPCFSKGLGAPAGSIILGSKAMMEEAFRIRKSWGGGMRQIGILAAAAMYAVKNNFGKLKEDHEKARMLAERIASFPDVLINPDTIQTNMVIFEPRRKIRKLLSVLVKLKGSAFPWEPPPRFGL